MQQIILILFVLVSAGMVGLILLQQGKGADMGASFGSGSSQTVFGAPGTSNVLSRATAVLAALFFAGSFALTIIGRNNASQSLSDGIPTPALEKNTAVQQAIDEANRTIEEIPVLSEDNPAPEATVSDQGEEFPAVSDEIE